MSDEKAKLKKLVRSFHDTLRGDAKAQTRVKAVNTLLNGGYNIKLLDNQDIDAIWESIFFALWYAEMGRGCEEIIAAVERACLTNYRLTRVGFQTIAKKWYGLDQYRVDKVSHLARHLLPTLIHHQISIWLKSCKRSKKLGTRDVYCKKLLKRTFNDVVKSHGLCYFLLEILAEEVTKSLSIISQQLHITTGKYELKANLIIFIYRQIVSFTTHITLDARLLRTFDQYVFKSFVEEILPNEAQLTQILVSLRLYQTLGANSKKSQISGKCKALLHRWTNIMQDVHENCINCEYFPVSLVPVSDTIQLKPYITN